MTHAAAGEPTDATISELATAVLAAGFDTHGYLQRNPDLVGLGSDPRVLAEHYARFGAHEGRASSGVLQFGAVRDLAQDTSGRQLAAALVLDDCSRLAADWDAGALRSAAQQWAELGAMSVLVVGDSHAEAYRCLCVSDDQWVLPIVITCRAGSAQGLMNPASRSGYGQRIRTLLPALAELPTFWKFGQVDTEFVWTHKWVRQVEGGGSVVFDRSAFRSFVVSMADRYVQFLSDVVSPQHRARHYVAGVFPPTLSDAHVAAGYANAHAHSLESDTPLNEFHAQVMKLEIPSLQTRTVLHAEATDLLLQHAGAVEFGTLRDDQPMLGSNGLVAEELTRIGRGSDHHLDPVPARRRISELLLKFGDLKPDW
jgi:hypothetical protein